MSPYTKEALEAQAEHWREEAERQRKMRFTEMFVGLVTLGALIAGTLWYVAWSQQQSDKRWCAFMSPLDQRYQKLVTEDPDAIEFAARLHALVTQDLNC